MDVHTFEHLTTIYGSTTLGSNSAVTVHENSTLLKPRTCISHPDHPCCTLEEQDVTIDEWNHKSTKIKTLKPNIVISLFMGISFLLGHFMTLVWIHHLNHTTTVDSPKRGQQLADAKLDYLNRRNTIQKDLYYRNSLFAHLVPSSSSMDNGNSRNNNNNNSNLDRRPEVDTQPILLGGSKNHNNIEHTDLNGCEGTIIILRHCEKGSLKEHCAYIGYERAIYLSTLFGSSPDHRWPKPSFLYALSAGGRSNSNVRNWREIETLLPLSQRINIPIDDSYGIDQSTDLAFHLLTDLIQPGNLCGKVALIAWKHDDIPHLAHELGCGPWDGCPDVYPSTTFDDAWQIKFANHYPFHDESTIPWNRMTEGESTSSSYPMKENPQWFVYGTVLQENFDPLAFSKKMGDYSEEEEGGGKVRNKWMDVKGEENSPENALGQTIYSENNTNR